MDKVIAPAKPKGKGGRPRVPIDWEMFDKLCSMQCTLTEIASWFKCTIDTIENAVKREHNLRFSEYYEQKSANGKIALRRAQFNMALKNPTLSIWLGKQWLGQKDIQRNEMTGIDGGPVMIDGTITAGERAARIAEILDAARTRRSRPAHTGPATVGTGEPSASGGV